MISAFFSNYLVTLFYLSSVCTLHSMMINHNMFKAQRDNNHVLRSQRLVVTGIYGYQIKNKFARVVVLLFSHNSVTIDILLFLLMVPKISISYYRLFLQTYDYVTNEILVLGTRLVIERVSFSKVLKHITR